MGLQKFGSPSTLKLIAAFAAVYTVWGSTYLAIHFAIDTMPPLIMLGARFMVAGLIMLTWLLARGQSLPPLVMWRNAAIVGTLTLAVGTGAVAWAEKWVASGVAALLVTTVPLFMVLLEWKWKGGRRPNRYVVSGLLLGLVGIVLLIDPAELIGSLDGGTLGMFVILLGSFSWSFGSILGRDTELPENPMMSTALQMTMGGVALGLGGLVRGEAPQVVLSAFTLESWFAWGYLVVFGSIIAFSSYVWLMHHVAPSRVATYAYVNPIVAVFLGWLLADEPLGLRVFAAVVVLVTAVVLISRFGRRPLKQRQEARRSRWIEAWSRSLDRPAHSAPFRSIRRAEIRL